MNGNRDMDRSLVRRWLCSVLLMLGFVACQLPASEAVAAETEEIAARPVDERDAEGVVPQGAGLFEIRNYHFRPDLLDAYRVWAENEAIPYLARHVDIVGFWFGTEIPAQVSGAPLDELGPANVTWIIRWDDMANREEGMATAFGTEEWRDIYSRVPGGRGSYLRIEARFFEAAARTED